MLFEALPLFLMALWVAHCCQMQFLTVVHGLRCPGDNDGGSGDGGGFGSCCVSDPKRARLQGTLLVLFWMAIFLLSLLSFCSKLEFLDWWTVSAQSGVVDDLSVMIEILVACRSWSPNLFGPIS